MLEQLISQILGSGRILSITSTSVGKDVIEKKKIQYENYWQYEFVPFSALNTKRQSDLLVASLNSDLFETISVDEVVKIIATYPNALIKMEFNFSHGYADEFTYQERTRANFLNKLNNFYSMLNCIPTAGLKPLDSIIFVKAKETLVKPGPLRVQKKCFDADAQLRGNFHVAKGFKADDLTSELAECLPFIKNRKRAIDVGARHGAFTRALLLNGFEQVSSFELVAHFREAFLKNVDTDKVDFFNVGLFERATVINFEGRAGKGIKEVGGNSGQLVYCIDDFELENVGLIKIDVDGCDRQILRGARKTIEKYLPVVHVETEDIQLKYDPEGLKNLEDIYQWLIIDLGYKVGHKDRNTVLYHPEAKLLI